MRLRLRKPHNLRRQRLTDSPTTFWRVGLVAIINATRSPGWRFELPLGYENPLPLVASVDNLGSYSYEVGDL